jgi:tetratricopeptide (TPR) repeat protein
MLCSRDDGWLVPAKIWTRRVDEHQYNADLVKLAANGDEAVVFYQRMVNLRPDLQGYLRIAHLRWLKGDLEGAREVMHIAVTAGSLSESEPTAWAYTRLGIYELKAGDCETAVRSAGIALQFAENYPAALLLRGRVLVAQGKVSEGIKSLKQAATRVSLPKYQWALADALREEGSIAQAEDVESRLASSGATNDPRTFALYLATRGQRLQQALALAERELDSRSDIFTMDAVALAMMCSVLR